MDGSLDQWRGAMSEAVSTLKRNDEKIFSSIESLHAKIDERMQRDADARASMLGEIGKVSGSVSLIVSVCLLFAKEGVSKFFGK